MKNHLLKIVPVTLLISMGLPALASEPGQMDINLGGGANLNINNANNNKMTTPLKNFSPVNVPQSQVDLAPLSTPPKTGAVNYFAGNKINTDVVDPDVKNADEAKELQKQTGNYIGKPPVVPADSQALKEGDITDFLKDYYGYLKDQGLSSGSAPIVPISHPAVPKKASANPKINEEPKELLATQQKLLKTSGPAQSQNANSP